MLFHIKSGFWLLLICGLAFLALWTRQNYAYRLREFFVRIKRRTGGVIRLNDSFSDDLESGLSSRNFDLISQNDNDSRSGLDDSSKAEVKRIMEQENLSFDKARFLYVERKFGQNGIAPDGTPLDPKAVVFNK
ncbi:hypothetical protein HG536_0C02760 [Torulaspora globosa]|uniref:Uncharacterized protein n=1 Tax=Torulaspora globosa TaxID=48254 RepID=A0A7G3ZF21_9SACH|nr:uncharacterized protein HG536_0C02760 [Torulaspora globosa]QLL32107.1 hypothetical protein HG536_0C02760 [Torulaspora globosa]